MVCLIIIASDKTCVLGAKKNHLIEVDSFEYPQYMFLLRNKKYNFHISYI